MPPPEKQFVLTHVVNNVSNLKENEYSYSEEEEHFNVPWKIGVVRKEEHLDFHVFCGRDTGNWSISTKHDLKIVTVTGKEFSKNGDGSLEYSDNKNKDSIGFSKLIIWADVVKDYKMLGTNKEFKLTHIVKDVQNLKLNELNYSDTKEHFYIPWRLCYYRNNGLFQLYLHCDHPNSSDWSIDTKFELKISSSSQKVETKSCEHRFENIAAKTMRKCSWGWDNFLKWEDVVTNYSGYMTIEANVKILKMTGIEKKNKLRNFDESMKSFSDVVLMVDNQRFYVSKLFLASQSTYFEALFLRNFKESQKSEIELNDIDPIDFQNFLELLYGESPIDDLTVTGILNLADMYDAQVVIRKCEEFLIEKSKKSQKAKLEIVKRFKLEKLKNNCLSKIKTVNEILSAMSSDPNEMDPSVVSALLLKSLELHKSGNK